MKLHLVDCGRAKEALELDAAVAAAGRVGVTAEEDEREDVDGVGRDVAAKKKTAAASRCIDEFLTSRLRLGPNTVNKSSLILTSHERAVRRETVQVFVSACNQCISCKNCGAHSSKMRADASNKIFQRAITQKGRKANFGLGVKIRPAASFWAGPAGDDGMGYAEGANGWASDDSEFEGDDDVGISTLSDEEEEKEDYGRSTVVSGMRQKDGEMAIRPDKFMHALEVEAQVRLTWRSNPFLCAKIFGCAYCTDSNNIDINNPKEKKELVQSDGNTTDPWGIFFMRAVPVTPSKFRPPMIMGTMTVEHAQNVYLNKILETNDRLRVMLATVQRMDENDGEERGSGGVSKERGSKDDVQARAISTWIDLQTTVNCYIDSSKDPSATPSTMTPNGIRQLLEKKEGIFRK